MQNNIQEDSHPQVSEHHSGAPADAADIERPVDLNVAKRRGERPISDDAPEYARRG
jgi:hypothetical protein